MSTVSNHQTAPPVVEGIGQLLQNPSPDIVAATLEKMAEESPTRLDIVKNLSGLAAILTIMRRHEESKNVQEQACRVLTNFCWDCQRINVCSDMVDIDDHPIELCVKGIIRAVVNAMQRHGEPSNGIQEWGCCVLKNLATNENTVSKTWIAQLDGLTTILATMKNNQESVNVQKEGCGVLIQYASSMSKHDKSACKEIIGPVVEDMRRHVESDELLALGCKTLKSLSADNDIKVEIARQGGIDTIIMAMQRYKGSYDIQLQGCGALRSLAVNEQNKVEIARQGGIDAILNAMRESLKDFWQEYEEKDYWLWKLVGNVQEEGCWALLTTKTRLRARVALTQSWMP